MSGRLGSSRLVQATHLGRRHGPDLEVVRSHEQIGDAGAHHANDPVVKILRLGAGDAGLERGVDHAVHAPDLLVLGQHRDVVLERVRHPEPLAPHVRDALMRVPIFLSRQSLVDTVVKVLVVREDDVAADIVQLEIVRDRGHSRHCGRTTYKSFGRDVRRRQTAGYLVGIDDEPRRSVLRPARQPWIVDHEQGKAQGRSTLPTDSSASPLPGQSDRLQLRGRRPSCPFPTHQPHGGRRRRRFMEPRTCLGRSWRSSSCFDRPTDGPCARPSGRTARTSSTRPESSRRSLRRRPRWLREDCGYDASTTRRQQRCGNAPVELRLGRLRRSFEPFHLVFDGVSTVRQWRDRTGT